jgi:predicted small secreted protein
MKKLFLLVLCVTLTAFVLVGCGPTSGNTVKTGLGVVSSIAKSTDAGAEDGLAEVDSMIAAVTVDKDGKIVKCDIDAAQTKINFSKAGKITTDLKTVYKTKQELGPEYGMGKVSKIGKEWNEQIAEFEKWMVGKTVDQIKAMKTKKVDDAHTNVPDVPDLQTKVTITVQDYIAAVEEAYKNAKETFG